MKTTKRYGVASTREHLLSGEPITRLEALLLYGMPDLTKLASDLRRERFTIERSSVSFADVIERLAARVAVTPPADLPVAEINLAQYRVVV